MLEKCLVEQCAPTLASLKVGSLFSYTFSDLPSFEAQALFWRAALNTKGLELSVLNVAAGRALIYVYRVPALKQVLRGREVAAFLTECGYSDLSPQGALDLLRRKLAQGDGFPHEIGIFLGYPLGDVLGFIGHCGQNSKCTGCWKVYGNADEAARLFQKYKKCTAVYKRLWASGRSVLRMTVPC